jgi:hypothetical protein
MKLNVFMKTELKIFQQLKAKVQSLYNILKLHTFEKKLGRKLALPVIDYLCFALLKHEGQITTKKKLWETFELESRCSYKTLVVNINRWYFLALIAISLLLKYNRQQSHQIKHTDSTDIPVCLNKNARYHKTMAGLASWDHNGKGYFYGLKLHLTADLEKRILAIKFASADRDERDIFIPLNKDLYGLFVCDAGYVSEELEEKFRIEGQRRILIAPRKNMKKLATYLDILIYHTRMTIELNFRNLKMFYGLITSLPRSVDGYLANYAYSLLAYMIA